MRGVFLVSLVSAVGLLAAPSPRREARWWKGNTHTHTLWSDGDAAPELSAAWYKQHGYHFLVLSEHNVQLEGERWVKVGTGKGEASPAQVQALVERFGAKQVEWREREGGNEMRLRTLEELRARFEDRGFLFIQGEEITDAIGPKRAPLHHNSMNHSHVIRPVGGDSMREAMEKTLLAVEEAARRTGKPMLAHLNHPNFHWAVTPDDVAHVLGERYFEVYNGHRGVRNHGDAVHAGTEAIWDYVLTLRLAKLGGDVLYGLATDDAHNYHEQGATATPGRGWIWVRSEQLGADAIVRAMQAGDFYASSGVKLEDVVATPESLGVRVAAEEGLTYVTKFIGTRKGGDVTGEVLQRRVGASADYRFDGTELYVRAVVVSSRRHPNGYDPDDFETAWTQPVRVAR
jgi:hypothetical protein